MFACFASHILFKRKIIMSPKFSFNTEFVMACIIFSFLKYAKLFSMLIYSRMKKYRTALFIGRFQPLHKGHLYSLSKACEVGERVLVMIAKSNSFKTENDPWHWSIRKKMLMEVVERLGLSKKIIKIFTCPDYPSDQYWLRQVEKRAGKFEVVVTNNEWVAEIMEKVGYPVYRSGLWRRETLEGVKIRKMIREGRGDWVERVPEPVVEILSRSEKDVS